MKKISIISILLLLIPFFASAHGLVTTQTRQIGKYGIEFEYNTIGNIVAGDYTLFDTYLVDPTNLAALAYDSVFVRLEKKDGPAVFAANIAASQDVKGYAAFSDILADPGDYTATTIFYAGGKELAEASFILTVDSQTKPAVTASSKFSLIKNQKVAVIAGIVILVIVLGLGALAFYKRKTS
jgi:hypothetical protein